MYSHRRWIVCYINHLKPELPNTYFCGMPQSVCWCSIQKMKFNGYQEERDTPSGFHAMRDPWACDNTSDSNMLILQAWKLKTDPWQRTWHWIIQKKLSQKLKWISLKECHLWLISGMNTCVHAHTYKHTNMCTCTYFNKRFFFYFLKHVMGEGELEK